ncbi:MAG: AAA family ATPase [Candidatus Dormibacteraeota bacterium]|jgi:hypothetical protein|nr:AAA family ATPase [Candidatus Dormibacteraeota bacterium]
MAFERLERTGPRAIGEAASADFLDREPVMVELSNVVAQHVTWLWNGWLPQARLSLCIGHAGQGKSWLSLAIAAAVSRGWPLPLDEAHEPGDVLLIGAEDGLADTVRPRLDALGADVDRIVALEGVRTEQGERGFLLADSDVLEQSLSRRPFRLVVIDPLTAFAGHTDSYKDAEVRGLLAPLAKLAEEYGPAILGIMHLRKGQADTALQRASGSIAWGAAARSVFAVGTDPQAGSGSADRHVVPVKHNLCPPPDGVMFALDGGHFTWGGPSTLSAAQLMAAQSDGNDGGAVDEAEAVLRQILAKGRVEAKVALAECLGAGLSEAAVRRARRTLGVMPQKEGFGGQGKWFWHLSTKDFTAAPISRLRCSSQNGDSRSDLGQTPKGVHTSEDERLNALATKDPDLVAPVPPSVAHVLQVFPGSRLVGRTSHRASADGQASTSGYLIDVPLTQAVPRRTDA